MTLASLPAFTRGFAAAALALSLWSAPAWAQDSDDDIIFDDEEESTDDSQRLEEGDNLDVDDSGDQTLDEFADPEDEEGGKDLLEGEPKNAAATSGDTAADYRAAQEAVRGAEPDDEIQAWEEYLAKWPGTPFRERIRKRIEELEAKMYSAGIEREGGDGDAMDSEIHLAQALQLENIDPRTRFQGGVEFGLPSYINIFVDYEHAITRKFSFHAGLRRRYTGYAFEPGVHWALVKSPRTNTLVAILADLKFNMSPFFTAIRPQLAIGKRFGDKLDLQLQAGAEPALRTSLLTSTDADGAPQTTTVAVIPLVGGASATYAASDTVKVFLETGWFMRPFEPDGRFYRYNVATFGMKFFPKKNQYDEVADDLEVNTGASVPYTYNYWTYHLGSVMIQANKYL